MLKYEIIETRFHPFLIRISKNENVTFAISEVMKKKSSTKSKVKIFSQGFYLQLEIKLELGRNL